MKENEWHIAIAGPPSPDFIYKNGQGDEFVLSMTGKLYGVEELKRWAPKFRGLPVYTSHLQAHESGNGQRGFSLTAVYDPRAYRGDQIGFIRRTGFSDKNLQVIAELIVTDSVWQSAFLEASMDDTLGEIGFSMTPSIYEGRKKLRVAEGVYFPLVEIMGVLSVDLTDQPLFGGQFLGTPPNLKWLAYAHKWHQKNIGDRFNVRRWNTR